MARYTGPQTKIARKFKEPIYGEDKWMERKPYGPGQHGPTEVGEVQPRLDERRTKVVEQRIAGAMVVRELAAARVAACADFDLGLSR